MDRALLIIVAIYGLGPRYKSIRDDSSTTRGSARYNTITLDALYDECEVMDENEDNLESDGNLLALDDGPLIAGSNVVPGGGSGSRRPFKSTIRPYCRQTQCGQHLLSGHS